MSFDIHQQAFAAFKQGFSGTILMPGGTPYDDARAIFNAMIDKHPAIIAQCADAQDVTHAVRLARETGLEISVHGGGHGVSGKAVSEGGLMIDLRMMHNVRVDPATHSAVVGGGATMSHLDRATSAFGMATTSGRASTTGVGGFTLGGGSGWIERKYGLACDNLLAVEIVTAEGQIVHASEEENQDLFWALHGGGGNFGVATSMTFRVYDLPTVTPMILIWKPEKGAGVLKAYREIMKTAPPEIGGAGIYLSAPDAPFVPRDMVNTLVFVILVVYSGPEAAARKAAAPLLGLGHDAEMIAEMGYADFQCMLDVPRGMRNYWSAEYLSSLPDEAIDRFCARSADVVVPSPSLHVMFPLGGALIDNDGKYPIPWRNAPWAAHPLGVWPNAADDARAIQWVRDTRTDMAPWAIDAVYLNFIGEEGGAREIAGYGRDNYARLAQVKRQYDPDNVFHLNNNIRPA